MKLPSPTEKRILTEVTPVWASGHAIKLRYMAKHGDIPNGSFYTMLRRLEENGWVSSRTGFPDESGDQRHRFFCTTEKTRTLKGKLDALFKAMEVFENKEELKA